MIKSQEVTRELRNFNSLFNSLIYRHEVSTAFHDFLTVFICCFARGTQEPLYMETIKKYNRDELETMAKMLGELLLQYQAAQKENAWIDPLGEYYEVLASSHKKSGLGQFFTPPALCEVITQITCPNGWDNTINDPACGSGRMLLAANKKTKGMYHIAQDLDLICTKMTAINLCMHQIRGEVHCMNSLSLDRPYQSFYINPEYHKHKTLLILVK